MGGNIRDVRDVRRHQRLQRTRRQRRIRAAKCLCAFAMELALCAGIMAMAKGSDGGNVRGDSGVSDSRTADSGTFWQSGVDLNLGEVYGDKYAEALSELLELNAEAADYVNGYPDREEYRSRPVDLTDDFQSGEVPLLMQWDRRWGYDAYGDSMIGLSGCGPVCLNMAWLYFTGDTSMTPRETAVFAYDNGYYTENGTSWDLWTAGAEKLGLTGATLSLDESEMKRALDRGGLIVCSMRPGDFTTTGHFILIRGYDKNGFYVNDPNRRSNSEKQWDFETLRWQIKNLWVLSHDD